MLPTTIRSAPSLGDYTSLEEYQTQTPESFTGGKPVLHFHSTGAVARVPKSQSNDLPIFPSQADGAQSNETNGDSEADIEQDVDVFATSESFTIFSTSAGVGVTIPYPCIAMHAIKQISEGQESRGVWMQLEFPDGGAQDEDDFKTIDLTIIPPKSSDDTPTFAPQLYEAIARCSNLHPDPHAEDDEDDDEDDPYDRIVFEGSVEHEALEGYQGVMRGAADGSLPPPMPGSGGWITAENVHEYFDEDGNWIGPTPDDAETSEAAGRTRGRDELEDGDADGQGPDETKRPRVD